MNSSGSPPPKLPSNPSLGLLSNRAKGLRSDHQAGDADAIRRLKESHPRFSAFSASQLAATELTLRDCQLVIAREYGFDNWVDLKRQVMTLQENGALEVALGQLIQAANDGNDEALQEVLDKTPDVIDRRGGDGLKTALHVAAANGHQSAAELLLQRGADPEIRCERSNATALHQAAGGGHIELVKLLLRYGVDPNGFGDTDGLDAIGWAVCFDPRSVEVADCLLEFGARHNIFSAVAVGDIEEIEEIVARSPSTLEKTTSVGFESQRPLHQAVVYRRPNVAAKLIELGADLEPTDVHGFTPLDCAALRSEDECVHLLLDRGARVGLPAAFGLQSEGRIEELMGGDPDCLKPGGGWQGLIGAAAQYAKGEVIESLLEWGASVDYIINSKVFGTKGYTPLHEAAFFGNMQAIEVFVRHGASLEKRDATHDCTPLEWAEHAERVEAANFLKKQVT